MENDRAKPDRNKTDQQHRIPDDEDEIQVLLSLCPVGILSFFIFLSSRDTRLLFSSLSISHKNSHKQSLLRRQGCSFKSMDSPKTPMGIVFVFCIREWAFIFRTAGATPLIVVTNKSHKPPSVCIGICSQTLLRPLCGPIQILRGLCDLLVATKRGLAPAVLKMNAHSRRPASIEIVWVQIRSSCIPAGGAMIAYATSYAKCLAKRPAAGSKHSAGKDIALCRMSF